MGIFFLGTFPESNPPMSSAYSVKLRNSTEIHASGEEGLKNLLSAPYLPDLVIISQNLTDMSGLNLCQKIRQNSDLANLPLLLIAEPELDGLAELVEAGTVDFLNIAFHPLELIARIRNAEAHAQKFRLMSGRDPLTRVSTMATFEVVLDREWRRAIREQQYLSLLQLDLDHFEQINQTKGHHVGDLCLKEIGELLSAYPLRPGDLVARHEDGESFWVLLPNTTVEGGRAVAETLRRQIEHLQINSDAGIVQLTASIGGATLFVHDDTQVPRALFSEAEMALQKAKEHGRNRVILSDLTEQQIADEL